MNETRGADDQHRGPVESPIVAGVASAPRFLPTSELLELVQRVSALPDGQYRQVLGSIRRLKKELKTGKPVRRISRGVRMNAADVKWSKAVKQEYRFTCAICGRQRNPSQLESAHLISRRYKNTRLLIENGRPMCKIKTDVLIDHARGVICHKWFDGLSELSRSAETIRILGSIEEYERLYKLAHSGKGGT